MIEYQFKLKTIESFEKFVPISELFWNQKKSNLKEWK